MSHERHNGKHVLMDGNGQGALLSPQEYPMFEPMLFANKCLKTNFWLAGHTTSQSETMLKKSF